MTTEVKTVVENREEMNRLQAEVAQLTAFCRFMFLTLEEVRGIAERSDGENAWTMVVLINETILKIQYAMGCPYQGSPFTKEMQRK